MYSLEAKAECLAGFLQSWKSGSCKHLPAPSWPSTAPEETKTKKTICAGNNAMEFRFGFTLKSKCGYNFQAHTHKRQESRQRLSGCGEEPASVLKRAVGYTKVVGKQKYRCFQANGPKLFGLNHHGLQTTRKHTQSDSSCTCVWGSEWRGVCLATLPAPTHSRAPPLSALAMRVQISPAPRYPHSAVVRAKLQSLPNSPALGP